MNGKTNYQWKNIAYAEKKIPSLHSQEFIGIVMIMGLTNVHAVV